MERSEINEEKEEIKKMVLEFKIPRKTELISMQEALERINKGALSPEKFFIIENILVKNEKVLWAEKEAIVLLQENSAWKLFIFSASSKYVQIAENISDEIVLEIKRRHMEEDINLLFRLLPIKEYQKSKNLEITDKKEEDPGEAAVEFTNEPGPMFG